MKLFALALASLALSASPSFAAKLAKISPLTNQALEDLSRVAGKSKSLTGVQSFKIVTPTPAKGRSADTVRRQTLKQAMVLGVCSFFDEAIDIVIAKDAHAATAALRDYVSGSSEEGEADAEAVEAALATAMKTDGLEVYGGDASGNNTGGAVVGVYDLKNEQVLVLGSSNCGSDN